MSEWIYRVKLYVPIFDTFGKDRDQRVGTHNSVKRKQETRKDFSWQCTSTWRRDDIVSAMPRKVSVSHLSTRPLLCRLWYYRDWKGWTGFNVARVHTLQRVFNDVLQFSY